MSQALVRPVEATRLRSATVSVADAGELREYLPASGPRSAWLRHGDGLVAIGEAMRLEVEDAAEAEFWWQQTVGRSGFEESRDLPRDARGRPLPGSGPIAFGSFTFDPGHTDQRSVLIVPELVIGRRAGRCWVSAITADGTPPLPRLPNRSAAPDIHAEVAWADDSMSGPMWQQRVAEVIERIAGSDLAKVVLARSVLAESVEELDWRTVLQRLSQGYENCWSFWVDSLIGASPEMLVRKQAGLATSRVLAGTIQRTGETQQDLALASALARSGKDLDEHEYAVASVARALEPFCSGMNVPDSPYVLELPNVLHLATDVTAVADSGVSSLALAHALHPSAAVCGTPTEGARALIREVEELDRGRYGGPVGWMDARGDGEWAIALRCGQIVDDHTMRLFAGCGIIESSQPAAELTESVAKLIPMREALS